MSYERNVEFFCENVRQLRISLKMSVKEFSNLMHVLPKDIDAINEKRLTKGISVSFLFRASVLFQIKADELLNPMSKQEIDMIAIRYRNK